MPLSFVDARDTEVVHREPIQKQNTYPNEEEEEATDYLGTALECTEATSVPV